MQSGKILGFDGFTIYFYKHFFELINNDLVLVAREYQRNGKVIGSLNSTFLCLVPKE